MLTLPAAAFLDNPLQITVLDDDTAGCCGDPEELGSCVNTLTEDDLRTGGFTIDSCDDTYYYGTYVTNLEFELNPS